MKLQKVKSRKKGNVQYYKYIVVLPPKDIESVGWKPDDELETIKRKQALVLKAKR